MTRLALTTAISTLLATGLLAADYPITRLERMHKGKALEKLGVFVETDAGGDPDDEQSLVRFLLYANEWDIEGIIANRSTARPGENLNAVRTGLGIVQQHLSAYGEIHTRLQENAPGFPTKQHLWERTVSGYADSDAGVDLIVAAVDRDDPRPVWFQNWGTDHGSAPSSLPRTFVKRRATAIFSFISSPPV